MECEGEGMVAVVRGLRDSGLAITLLDGARQYTLMPNNDNNGSSHLPVQTHSPTRAQLTQHASARSQTHESCAHRTDSAAQATDGRYASMYKMTHCRVTPTSPVPLLPEFPPQKAELCPGHGNFEVGGPGSGENYTPCKSGGSFRGAMSWPDRGSVCSPRPSREPDPFANSLRKYPSISIERSTEMVERLITYTQAKNISKSYQNRSPPRHGPESNSSNQISTDRNNSRNAVPRTGYYQKNYYEPEVTSNGAKPRIDESPTRCERSDCDCVDYRRPVMRAYKYKEMSRKVKENMRNLSSYPYNQPMLSPATRDRYYEHNNNLNGQRTSSVLTATNSVNIEVQAATKMVSKEVATVPRTDHNQRTVAVPLSPTSSIEEHKAEGDVSDLAKLNLNTPTYKSVETVPIDDHKAKDDIKVLDQRHAKLNLNTPTYKSIETGTMPVDLSVQTTSSVVDIANNLNHIHNDRCSNIKRRSKSAENFHKDFSEEIFELLKKVSVCPNSDPQSCLLRRKVLRQMSQKLKKMTDNMNWNEGIGNTKDQIGQMLKYVPIWEPCGDVQAYRDAISDEILNRMNRYRTIDVYRAETRYGITDGEILDVVLKNWLSNILLKSFDVNGKPAHQNKITQIFINRLKQLILSKSTNGGSYQIKLDIYRIISKLPLEVQDNHKTEYLHSLTESLLHNLSSYTFMNFSANGCTPEFGSTNLKGRKKIINKNKFKNYIQPTEEEIRDCISDEVKQFLDKNCSSTNSVDTKEVEIEIIDYLIDSIQAIRTGEDYIESELTMLLCQDIDSISWSDAKEVARRFLKLVEDMFSSNSCQKGTHSYQSQSYVVQNAATHNYSKSNTNEDSQTNNFSIEQISKRDIDANFDAYMNQLTAQIDEWLANPQMQVPQAHDSGFRQVVVHDLAGDIIDRHIYLELNPSSRGSDADELEYLKYQIFKWINKLAGEDNMETISNAPELMRRIQSIPVPMLTKPNVNSSMSRRQSFNRNQVQPMYVNERRRSLNQTQPPEISAASCSSTHPKPISPSVKKLNDEYDEFLKKWIQEIPIKTSNPAEQELADKARLGIYNGIWKAITKLKCEPAIFNNQFYYEDALDNEIEELLSALPKTPELDSKKHLLKIRLIEKTTNTNELIKSIAAPASFKQQLIENVSNSLPHMTANKEAPMHSNEERQILKIVDDYILCANYKEVDTAKANIYRKKLIKEAQTLLDNIKKTHGEELKGIDTDVYLNNIFHALHKVPLPNEAIVKDETIEILLGNEVEQWMLDIPVASNGDEQQQRKTLKDALVKRIIEIEKQVNIFDCSGEKVLKREIASFLESVPLKQGEKLNTTFMTEELVNRMKNRAQEMQAGNIAHESGAFMDSAGYYEFSQHMPFCSSFSELPGVRPAVRNQSSYMIRDGTRVKEHEYNYFTEPTPPPHVPLPSEEYFTLYENTPPKQQPPVQHQYSKLQSYKTIPPETIHRTINQSLAHNKQPYLDTARDRTVPPPTQVPELQQSPCCRSAAVNLTPQQLSRIINESGQPILSNVRADQFPQAQFDVPPCCDTKQGNTSRFVNPQDRVGTPVRTSYPEPIAVSQLPQGTRRSSKAHPQFRATEQQQQVKAADTPQPGSFQEAGQQQQAEAVVPQHGYFHQIQATRRASQPRPVPGQMSTYGEPRYFSTPQQVIAPPQESPPRPGRKQARGPQRYKRHLERRRLDLEDDIEEESEEDEPCHCLERMMRLRRPPMCYTYEDFEMDQYYPFPHGSHRLVTNNFTVKLCGDVHMGERSVNQKSLHNIKDHKNIKSVQTSFSSVDLVPTRKCQNCNRKIKSQEDLRNWDRDVQLENEVIDWLRETCNAEATSKWGEKMQRLAQKINKPGGEEKIRQKIQKYLRRVSNQFSESDEERRAFREQLPDSIIKKLKKMCSKPDRNSSHTPSVRIFRIEIPKEYYEIEDKFRAIVKNWMKDIPIKKRDFLGRAIKKDDVIDSVAFQLKPYILNRENYDKDYRSTLKAIIEEILIEMPLEMNSSDNPSYYNRLALTLLNNIIHLYNNEHHNETSFADTPKNHQQENKLRDFIFNEISNILNKVHLSASTKKIILLEEELKDVLEIIERNGFVIDDTTKDTVFTILNKLGGLSEYQENYFTDVILKHFKEFNEKSLRNISPKDSKDKQANTEVSYNNTYSVFHNAAEIKYLHATNRKSMKNNEDLTINDEIKSNTVFYKRRVMVQIEDWLNELHVDIPFENRDKVVRELAEDILDRCMYLEISPKSTDESELQYLKYQIFKWINKVAGENTMETIERANELMERIKCIETPNLFKSKEEKKHPPLLHKIISLNNSQLKQLIVDCFSNLPNVFDDVTNKLEIIDDLALNLSRKIKTNANIDDVIDKEVERWIQNVYRGKYERVIKHKLIKLLKNILGSRKRLNSKTEKLMIRKYEDLIDDCIDDFAKTSKEIINIDDRNKHTHELAMQLFNLINGDEILTSTYLETVALKWAKTLIGKQTIRREWASKLIDSILNYNNEVLAEKNHQESETNKFQTNYGLNPILQSNEEQLVRRAHDIAVYGVTLPSNSKPRNKSVVDSSINEITDDDIQATINLYLKQLVEQIDSWLGTLDIPQIHDKGFREIVINDLAGDIIDRHKYLELNPSSRGSDESEVEQLKYQIFKWINKLVGEDQSETVEHASELMNRIRSIPVPMMSKPLDKSKKGNNNMTNRNEITKTSANQSNVRLSNPLGFTTGPMAATSKNVAPMPSQTARGSLQATSNVNLTNKRLSGPPVLGVPKTQTRSEEPKNLQDCKTVEEVYQYFDVVFQERVKEIPLETPTPEQKSLAELARKGLHNGIWKTFLHLRADPQIDNDYSYFEMAFEDELDNLLDCLPQTGEIQKIRHTWKIKVLCDVIGMLKYIHSITDSPSFRQALTQKFNRRYLREKAQQKSDYLQQLHIASIAKEYILMTKYKTEDPVKAEAYRQRLMKKVNEFAESIKREANVDFVSINRAQFAQMAMKLLASVPIPHDEILKDEAEEILITEEVDQWYNGLPVQPLKNETDDALRKRMRELLARKLHEIEKRLDLDESAEYDMKHEVLKFLHERAELQPTESIRLDFMVEELINRLKNRRDQNKFGYESFEREKPLSSTFAQTDRGEVLAPLVDAGIYVDTISPHENQGVFRASQVAGPSHQSVLSNEVPGPNSQVFFQRRMSQAPPSHQGQGVLGTSEAGPSVQELIQRHQTPPPCCQGQDVSHTNQVHGPNSQVLSQRRMSQPPTNQGQGVLGQTSQIAGLSGLGYQQPIDPQPRQTPDILRTSQAAPNEGIASERSGNQSYHAPSVQATDRSQYPSNAMPCANHPSSQMGAQIHPDNVLGSGQASSNAPVNTDFMTTQGATRSTARVVSPVREEPDEDTDGGEEIRFRCRCMKRSWKCKRRRFYEDRPYCYPVPFPCRYFY